MTASVWPVHRVVRQLSRPLCNERSVQSHTSWLERSAGVEVSVSCAFNEVSILVVHYAVLQICCQCNMELSIHAH